MNNINKEQFAELDKLAWHIVCNWHKDVNFDPIYDEIDFSLLTRSLFRTYVGRAIRKKYGVAGLDKEFSSSIATTVYQKGSVLKRLVHSFRTYLRLKNNRLKKVCYVPQYARPISSLCSELFVDNDFLCVTRDTYKANKFIYPVKVKSPVDFIDRLFDAFCSSLKKRELSIDEESLELLKSEISQLGTMYAVAHRELEVIQPDVILLYNDEALPQMCYVLIAKQMGIKTVCLQHGLACERFYLDEPYADLLLLWGCYSENRYLQSKNMFKSLFKVVGNPEYDYLDFSDCGHAKEESWLWVTRPHTPDKCYSPSRSESEGIDILNAILDALEKFPAERLIIKPHPYDYVELYKNIILKRNMNDRAVIVSDKLPIELFDGAKVVLSEDSTAGLEAVLYKKKLIHVNFSSQPAILPFADYKVGLLAENSQDLYIQLDKVLNKGYTCCESDIEIFIKDFLCLLTGSTERCLKEFKDFILS